MSTVRLVRPAAVAGRFYSDESLTLRKHVEECLHRPCIAAQPPKALIVPHAGYAYSGPVAGTAYAQLKPFATRYQRVILLGPSHRVGFSGLATPSVNEFETPLGRVAIDRHMCDTLERAQLAYEFDAAHQQEHSLEVQLPFLQVVLPEFQLVPLVVGKATATLVADVLNSVWDGPETLIVVSSDLSHFHDYRSAQHLDNQTVELIELLQLEKLTGDRACGFMAIRGLLLVARERGLRVKAIDVRNSGDTFGGHDHVVGYASFIVSDEEHGPNKLVDHKS